jgi:magnesium transporter
MSNNSAVDLADEIKSRSATGAAAKLANLPGPELASELAHLNPAFTQDVLAALPNDARERAISAAPADLAQQWQRNSLYDPDTIGRMMEPVVAAFPPDQTVDDTVDQLRELVTRALITYVYVVDSEGRLLGIVTMRDLLFSERSRRLEQVMLRGAFALHAAMPLRDAMRLVLDRHYPVYPVVDAAGRLIGLVRGQTMFEAQAVEISLQAGTMVGLEKEERLATHWFRSLKLRHPWRSSTC